MKKITILTVLFLFLSIQFSYAHPPSSIEASFDASTKMLSAVISHQVNNPTKHFIKEVEIELNGEEIIEREFKKQDDNAIQSINFEIPDASPGDLITIEAYCSISGKLTKKLSVGQ